MIASLTQVIPFKPKTTNIVKGHAFFDVWQVCANPGHAIPSICVARFRDVAQALAFCNLCALVTAYPARFEVRETMRVHL